MYVCSWISTLCGLPGILPVSGSVAATGLDSTSLGLWEGLFWVPQVCYISALTYRILTMTWMWVVRSSVHRVSSSQRRCSCSKSNLNGTSPNHSVRPLLPLALPSSLLLTVMSRHVSSRRSWMARVRHPHPLPLSLTDQLISICSGFWNMVGGFGFWFCGIFGVFREVRGEMYQKWGSAFSTWWGS